MPPNNDNEFVPVLVRRGDKETLERAIRRGLRDVKGVGPIQVLDSDEGLSISAEGLDLASGPNRKRRSPNEVTGANFTVGEEIPRYSIVHLENSHYDLRSGTASSETTRLFKNRYTVNIGKPDRSKGREGPDSSVGVAMEKIGKDRYGLVAVGGILPVQVDLQRWEHTHADIKNDNMQELESTWEGRFEILWHGFHSGNDDELPKTVWAICKINAPQAYRFFGPTAEMGGTTDADLGKHKGNIFSGGKGSTGSSDADLTQLNFGTPVPGDFNNGALTVREVEGIPGQRSDAYYPIWLDVENWRYLFKGDDGFWGQLTDGNGIQTVLGQKNLGSSLVDILNNGGGDVISTDSDPGSGTSGRPFVYARKAAPLSGSRFAVIIPGIGPNSNDNEKYKVFTTTDFGVDGGEIFTGLDVLRARDVSS